MITPELRSKIRRLFFGEHWKMGTIAAELGVHRDAVEHAIERERFINLAYRPRASCLDAYKEFVRATLEEYPRLRSTRLLEMLRPRGYAGTIWQLRRFVACSRPSGSREAFFRLSVLPGEQAQVDWGHFGTIAVGSTRRALSCFVMVLAYSRALFACFVLDQTQESFMRCHIAAFRHFGGVPRSALFDNLKSVVLEREGTVIRFHPRFLDFAGYYHFNPTPVGIARGNEKGRVERAIRYLRESFFAARHFRDLDHLNAQLTRWLADVADARQVPGDSAGRTVAQALDEERQRLLPLPQHAYVCEHVRPVASGKTPYVRFDGNDYSIPYKLVRKPLTLAASDERVRILDGDREVAVHARCWDRKKQVEQQAHLAGLSDDKRAARNHRGRNRLFAACQSAEAFLGDVALHGGHLGGTTTRLLHLLDEHGKDELDAAIAEAHKRGALAAGAVAHILEQRRRGRRARPTLPPILPADPRVRDLVVPARPLDAYDRLDDDSESSAPGGSGAAS
jgi:transposase